MDHLLSHHTHLIPTLTSYCLLINCVCQILHQLKQKESKYERFQFNFTHLLAMDYFKMIIFCWKMQLSLTYTTSLWWFKKRIILDSEMSCVWVRSKLFVLILLHRSILTRNTVNFFISVCMEELWSLAKDHSKNMNNFIFNFILIVLKKTTNPYIFRVFILKLFFFKIKGRSKCPRNCSCLLVV